MVAGIVGIGIACLVIWLYVGFSLAEGQLTLPVGRRHDYTLRGPVAWAAGLALILLTLALLTHALQFIDDRRAKRYATWRRYSVLAAVVVLGLTVLWQLTHRLL
jgi:small-conductance mechanosensitive channel